jgi:hypothetical protein
MKAGPEWLLDPRMANLPSFTCMKRMFLAFSLAAALAGQAVLAQEKAKEPAGAPAEAAGAKATTERKLPMNSRADEIDVAQKTFTHVTAAGKRVKHILAATTPIQQGEAVAKFEDIKVGDTVSGSRVKVSDTEYTVVKITKFGVVAKKAAAKPKE